MTIEFTDEELKLVNSFEPMKTKEYLNDLLRDKINVLSVRIEIEMKRKHCYHKEWLDHFKASDTIGCSDCGKVWK